MRDALGLRRARLASSPCLHHCLQHLGLLGTASIWAAHRFNDRQVWSCSSCCRRNLSAAYSHYQQPCVKEPSEDNFREAMHGDAARTAALLLMIACSTDAPAAVRC